MHRSPWGCPVKGSSNTNGGCIWPHWLILREMCRAVNGLSHLIRVNRFHPQQQHIGWKVSPCGPAGRCIDTGKNRRVMHQGKLRHSSMSFPTRKREICISMAEINVTHPCIYFSLGSDEQLARETKAEAPITAQADTKLRHSIARQRR